MRSEEVVIGTRLNTLEGSPLGCVVLFSHQRSMEPLGTGLAGADVSCLQLVVEVVESIAPSPSERVRLVEFLCQELSLGAKDVTESSNSSVEGLTSSVTSA